MTEHYVVDALSFTEAESAILEEMKVYISGDYKITDIKPAAYHEIFFSDMDKDDKWYKAKLMFITLDEKSGKEKRSAVTYLVQASTLPAAVKNITDVMGGTMIDYEIANVAETQIMDVFEHDSDPEKHKQPENQESENKEQENNK